MAATEVSEIEVRIRRIYSGLEGLTFRGDFDDRAPMRQFRRREPPSRPVYRVTDTSAREQLEEVHRNMAALERELGGKEIWKGITVRGGCKLWGSEESVDGSDNGTYHIPVGGIEVIFDGVVDYRAIVNITVELNY